MQHLSWTATQATLAKHGARLTRVEEANSGNENWLPKLEGQWLQLEAGNRVLWEKVIDLRHTPGART